MALLRSTTHKTRAEAYREIAMEAVNCIAGYRAKAEEYAARGEREIAREYMELLHYAVARAYRYLRLAEFAENTPQEMPVAPETQDVA